MNRDSHHPSLSERFAGAPPAPEDPTPAEATAHRLKTPEGKALYAKRKCTPVPVFGIIKSVLGFRQFLLRGLENVRGEWSLVTVAWNVKRMFAMKAASGGRFRLHRAYKRLRTVFPAFAAGTAVKVQQAPPLAMKRVMPSR